MHRAAPPSCPRADRSPGDDGCVAHLLAAVHPVHVPIPRFERASDGTRRSDSLTLVASGWPPAACASSAPSSLRVACRTSVCRLPHSQERPAHEDRAPEGEHPRRHRRLNSSPFGPTGPRRAPRGRIDRTTPRHHGQSRTWVRRQPGGPTDSAHSRARRRRFRSRAPDTRGFVRRTSGQRGFPGKRANGG